MIGAEEIEKKNFEALIQEKTNLKGLLAQQKGVGPAFSRKAFPRKKICRGDHEEKINSFSTFPPPPGLIIFPMGI